MKREDQNIAWSELAKVPRRSYLGKYRRLTPAQSRWVRSLLGMWGREFGGSGTEHLTDSAGMWSMILTGWTGEQQERITTVLAGLRKMGYSGDQLITQAKAIIWPKKSLSDLMEKASDEEEAEFMERVILKSFAKNSIVYEIGKDYYTWRKTINDMARWMQYRHAPFLTEKQCIDRVRWCIDLFNSAVFFTLIAELGIENKENCKKDLKTSFEDA
ncbi:TPA: DUF1133 family protein [Citrobacter freundii]|uniref:DUF1133 family protein n=1 Tax=Citrobacter TaxID=544 RepID=UPI0008FCE13F|nr:MULTISPECIES: DUF1133 family protein [Citrobacter]ELK7473493.1 DUF1133 family protein [Citrobacter freundii]MDM3189118.1 DUF1133 family protein [Citrobacter sp. Cf101]OIZ35871.1 hypothetical protein BEH70_23815 [Citrobacter freundii]QXR24437.1 DUF1133 family protein [Citrobacter freundii]HBB6884833.1 DUF1133 family protein [Citrobacter freundii]